MSQQDYLPDEASRFKDPQFDRVAALVNATRLVTLVIAMFIWAIIGFLFWIPMMCYATARFSALVVYTTIVDADPSSLAIHLEHSVRFYFQGFRNILRAMYRKPAAYSTESVKLTIHWGVVVLHVGGTLLFWTVVAGLILLVVLLTKKPGQEAQHPPVPKDEQHPPVPKDEPVALILTNSMGMTLVFIPAGTFLMGSPKDEGGRYEEEGPQHEVEISKPFYLGQYPVTVAQFRKFVEAAGYDAGTNWRNPDYAPTDQDPVVKVSWNDAKACCAWLGKKEDKQYRLPTEAEWEYSCRAGSRTAFFFGDDAKQLGDYAWYHDNTGDHPKPVGGLKPNALGLYDMHGNVWQWCEDWYDPDYYKDSPPRDPQGPTTGSMRVDRGGSIQVPARNCRSATRDRTSPAFCSHVVGFRVVLVP